MKTTQRHSRGGSRHWPLLWLLCCALPAALEAANTGETCTDPCLKATIAALYFRSPFLGPLRIDIAVRDWLAPTAAGPTRLKIPG